MDETARMTLEAICEADDGWTHTSQGNVVGFKGGAYPTSMAEKSVLNWLLAGDPAVRWQVERDLLTRSTSTWQRTRKRVASEGWGARLLTYRTEDGTWGGGLYTPKWTSTFYTLRTLVHLGVEPTQKKCAASCQLLLDRGVQASGGVALWNSGVEDTCVTAMLVSMACYFKLAKSKSVERMTEWLLVEQMPDGGWNCERRTKGATHSSFHTTVSVLEAVLALRHVSSSNSGWEAAAERGREFFLEHQLYRSSTTGEVVRASFEKFSFPPRWFFDVLRGLEYFAQANAPWDSRLSAAVDLLEARRGRDGRWRAQNHHTGKEHFRLEAGREGSRLNTLRALRIQDWLAHVRER